MTEPKPPRPPGVGRHGPLPGAQNRPINHNSNGGHRAHLRRGENPVRCRPCLDAHARYEATRRERAKKL